MSKEKDREKVKRKKSILIVIIVLTLLAVITFVIFQMINSPFNDVMVNVNGTEIKTDYLLKRLYFDDTELADTLNTIVEEEVIRQFADGFVQLTDEEVYEYQMASLEAMTGQSDPEVLDELIAGMTEEAGFTDPEMDQLLYTDALSAKLNQYLISRIQTVDEQVHVQAILFDSEVALNAALLRIDAGEEFEDLASELNPTEELRQDKGDLGWLARSSLDANLAASVFDEMTAGQISEPFLFGESYALFYVVAHEQAREIDADILESMKLTALDDWLDYQRAMSDIEIADISVERENWINWQLQKMRKESDK